MSDLNGRPTDYISVSEFAQLLNTILNTSKVNSYLINKILQDNNTIKKMNKKDIHKSKNKYIVNSLFQKYCKESIDTNCIFYIWNANYLFAVLGINFFQNITKKDAIRLCNFISKYVFEKFDINIIHRNLIFLQMILRDCILYQ